MTVKGCGLFRRPVRKSIFLVSATLDPPGIPRLPLSKGLSRQSFQVLHFDAPELRTAPNREENKVPPPYTPAIVVRAGISSNGGLLYAGDSLPLKLWARVPLVAQGQLKAVLKSVRLFMVDPTVVSNCGRRVVRPAGTFIREIQLNIALQTRSSKNEIFEVDAACWKGCNVPQSLSMTKSTNEVAQPHLLQVLCEFTCDGNTNSVVRYSQWSLINEWLILTRVYSSRACWSRWTLLQKTHHRSMRPLASGAGVACLKRVCLRRGCLSMRRTETLDHGHISWIQSEKG